MGLGKGGRVDRHGIKEYLKGQLLGINYDLAQVKHSLALATDLRIMADANFCMRRYAEAADGYKAALDQLARLEPRESLGIEDILALEVEASTIGLAESRAYVKLPEYLLKA